MVIWETLVVWSVMSRSAPEPTVRLVKLCLFTAAFWLPRNWKVPPPAPPRVRVALGLIRLVPEVVEPTMNLPTPLTVTPEVAARYPVAIVTVPMPLRLFTTVAPP